VWTHPVTGRDVQYSATTIEHWYYKARNEEDDPVRVLQRAIRKDSGKISLGPKLAEHLRMQYRDHPHWTYQLHYDNLASAAKADPSLAPLCSYSTVKRYMQASGMVRKRRPPKLRPGEARAARRRENREVRSYEAEYVGSLWHLDFHHGSLKVLTGHGQWQRPIALGILDDHSRLCCHLQWYLSETAEDLVHGFSQAIQKRGLPRALLTDNGAAMVSDEFTEGLLSLGIVHEKTLPYSPHQNGKQERLWATMEGRLMEMLELLNHALAKAGNTTLMTDGLMDALVDHSAGNYRLLMTMSAELLAYGIAHEVNQLDEKFYLELFHPKGPTSKKKVRA
jgi:transposase InsO family protein